MNADLINVLLQLGLGGSLPPVIDLLNKFIPNSKLRFLVTISICLVVGALVHRSALRFETIDDVFMSFGLILSGSQTIYKSLYEDSTLQNLIRASKSPKQAVAVR